MNAKASSLEAVSAIEQGALELPLHWEELKRETLLMIEQAATDQAIYESLAWCLASLNDSHSFLLSADKKRVRATRSVKDRKLIFHEGRSKYARPEIEGKELKQGQAAIGYIYVPGYDNNTNSLSQSDFAQVIQSNLAGLASQGVRGWIVDLRGNSGGNMWPMIAGLGPLMTGPKVGAWTKSDDATDWMYQDGEAFQKDETRMKINAKCAPELNSIPDSVPVAVLIDRFTASSGEALAICFSGRRNTKFFGERTWGIATANAEYKLRSGATMYLTIAYDADRNGKLFKDGVEPDFAIPEQTDLDAVLEKAQEWLTDCGTDLDSFRESL